VNCPGTIFDAMLLNGIEPPAQPTAPPPATAPGTTLPPAEQPSTPDVDVSTTSSTAPG
jgi:hypothetical protein